MREVDIVYLYEHASRELDVACAAAAILEKEHGLSVEIVQWPVGFSRIVHKLRPTRLVVFPFFYEEKEFKVLLEFWNHVKYFNLTWEQLFYAGNKRAKTPRGDLTVKNVLHHSWSSYYTDFLISSGIPAGHIFTNGQPAYTLYEAPYKQYFMSREELASKYKLDPSKRWIFFPENYNWAFYTQARLDLFIRNGQAREDVYAMKEYCDISFSKVLHWFQKMLSDHKDVELIVRPRPSMPMAEFQHALDQVLGVSVDRLHVIQEESVREWILASDIVISSHSTSLIEASIAGKAAYMLEPIPMPEALKVEWQDLLHHITTFEDLNDRCGKHEIIKDSRLEDWARGTLMANGDSILNLTKLLADLCASERKSANISQVPLRKSFQYLLVWSVFSRLHRWYLYWRTGGIEAVFVKDMISASHIRERIKKWLKLPINHQIFRSGS
jgi:surface carbohydrate biosynthesis protein